LKSIYSEGKTLPKKAMSVKQAAVIAQRIADEQNVELVDVELVKEPGGYFSALLYRSSRRRCPQ